METNLITLALTNEEVSWLQILLHEIPLWENHVLSIMIRYDSTIAIGRVRNHYYSNIYKLIRRKHIIVRSNLTSGVIIENYIKSCDNLTNLLTKPLAIDKV